MYRFTGSNKGSQLTERLNQLVKERTKLNLKLKTSLDKQFPLTYLFIYLFDFSVQAYFTILVITEIVKKIQCENIVEKIIYIALFQDF